MNRLFEKGPRVRTSVIYASIALLAAMLVSSMPLAHASNAPTYRLSGLSLDHTCNPHCADLSTGTSFGWSEGDWWPAQLAVNTGSSAYSGTLTVDLDYHTSKPSEFFGIDAFASCGPIAPDGGTSAAEQCGNGNAPTPFGSNYDSSNGFHLWHILVDGVDTDVASSVVIVSPASVGEADESIQFSFNANLSPGVHTIEWANHLSVSGGLDLANGAGPGNNPVPIDPLCAIKAGDCVEPSNIPANEGSGHWPGARLHMNSDLSGTTPGVRDVPIMVSPTSTPSGTSSTTTTFYDTGTTVTNTGGNTIPPATGFAGDSFYDTATITPSANSPTPTGSVDYLFFSGSGFDENGNCNGAQINTDDNGHTWPYTVNLDSNGNVPNSQATGPLNVGSYAFEAVYSGDSNYTGSTSACEPFSIIAPAPPIPAISKTINPSLNETFTWQINKQCSFDNVHYSQNCSKDSTTSPVTVYYNVTVTHDAGTNSSWKVKGDITITPAAGSLNYTSVVDNIYQNNTLNLDTNANCLVSVGKGTDNNNYPTSGSNLQIPTGVSVDFPYVCTYSGAPLYNAEANNATISWPNQNVTFTENSVQHVVALGAGSVSTLKSWAWKSVSPAVTDGCTTVRDTNNYTNPPTTTTLGTVCIGQKNPYIFHYQKSYTLPADKCLNVVNNATSTTSTTHTIRFFLSSVTICPHVSGGLTMGFWQNQNGQTIISKYCGGTSGTSLYAYLRGLGNSTYGSTINGYTNFYSNNGPFQDLATTTCGVAQTSKTTGTGEALYVYNLIKAANAGGATMNAMLKAQMLATALDVYFSTPSLGGNQISAPTALGAVKIDLTNVCSMIDSSGGTATCSGTNINTSLAFASKICTTVQDLLNIAADQSNSGGSIWYTTNGASNGQLKATQGLAKNTFDAINNSAAFVC